MAAPLIHTSHLLRPYDGPRNLDDQVRLAEFLAKAATGLPPAFVGDPGGILALMYRAIALDIPLMVAADNLVFDRRGCAMRARLMKALVTVRAGHRLVPVETTDKIAIVRLEYNAADGRAPLTVEWTIATALENGLVKDKSAWIGYASSMLYWRAMAKAVNLGCPEATLGLGIIEARDPNDDTDDGEDHPTRPTPTPETVVVTDGDGRPVADDAVADILNSVATRDPDTGRPLVRDTTTIDDLRAAWNAAAKEPGDGSSRPITRFAHADGDDRFTLQDVLADLVEQVTARDREAAAIAATQEPAPVPVLDAAAGTGGPLPCGCDAATVTATGQHSDGCRR